MIPTYTKDFTVSILDTKLPALVEQGALVNQTCIEWKQILSELKILGNLTLGLKNQEKSAVLAG
jgi:hypothetical protein